MSLGNVNICHTVIINCDPPRIEKPHKTKKNMDRKRDVSLLFLCGHYVLMFLSSILRIKIKRFFC